MTVNELIQELQKIPEDMKNTPIMYYSGAHKVSDLNVYFEQKRVLDNYGSYTAIIMRGEY